MPQNYQTLHVQLAPHLADALSAEVRRTGEGKSDIVRRALRSWFDYQTAKRKEDKK